MNIADLRMKAQGLLFALDVGADPVTLKRRTQELIVQLGGRKDAARLSPGSASLYLVVLLISQLDAKE